MRPRLPTACLFLLALIVGCGAAIDACRADRQTDRQDCRSQDLDLNIPACTRIIDDATAPEIDRRDAYARRGFAYLLQNSVVSAERDFGHLIQVEPGNVNGRLGKAIAEFRRGSADQAILDYSLARRLDPAAVDALTAAHPEVSEIAAAAAQRPASQNQLDDLQRGLITCRPGSRQQGSSCVPIACPPGQRLEGSICVAIACGTGTMLQGSSCVPITCAQGQRLDGNNCVQIVCGTGYALQGSACVPITCPQGQRLDGSLCVAIVCGAGTVLQGSTCLAMAPPRPLTPTLLAGAAASRWCTSRRAYSLKFEVDQIVWTDNQGSVDIERILSDDTSVARTVTRNSIHPGGDTVPRGTVWTYSSSGAGRIDVSKNGARSFSLTRC